MSTTVAALSLSDRLAAIGKLMKFRLAMLVVFSSAMTWIMGGGTLSPWPFAGFLLGGFLVTAGANTINQILERDLDRLMARTANRPLPTGQLTVAEAWAFAALAGIGGTALLWICGNPLTALLGAISLLSYAFLYTPLKRQTPFAVAVGAFPGAMPPLIGWVAATGHISIEALILFFIQFIWQFPHFWAIAWVLDDDYRRAGFKLLPSGGGRDLNTAFQIMIYTLFLLPLGLLPTQFGMTGTTSGIIATVCGALFLMQTFYLMKECSRKAALGIMFGSFFYLPIVQIAYVLDRL